MTLRVVVKDLQGSVETAVKALTLEIHAELVKAAPEGGTPVDTGWARANWVPNIGTPERDTVGTREQAEAAGGNFRSAVPEQGLAVVAASYRLQQGPVYVSNNVPYIENLNAGSSKQAPSGFVQKAIRRAVSQVQTKLRFLE